MYLPEDVIVQRIVCDDGAVFYWSYETENWEEMEPIPGTEHWIIKAQEANPFAEIRQ
jgi:hypothetical protein